MCTAGCIVVCACVSTHVRAHTHNTNTGFQTVMLHVGVVQTRFTVGEVRCYYL